jgi:hypothetical protein
MQQSILLGCSASEAVPPSLAYGDSWLQSAHLRLVCLQPLTCMYVSMQAANIYVLVDYQHPEDRNQAWFPKVVVVFGLTVAVVSVLMFPMVSTGGGGWLVVVVVLQGHRQHIKPASGSGCQSNCAAAAAAAAAAEVGSGSSHTNGLGI